MKIEEINDQEEEIKAKEQIYEKGLSQDLFLRLRKAKRELSIKDCIKEITNKLVYYKDFEKIRSKMSAFYQNKLSKYFYLKFVIIYRDNKSEIKKS